MFDSMLICENIAEKMRDPNIVRKVALNTFQKNQVEYPIWLEESFISGIPGISYFYAAMHSAFPKNSWDLVAEKYVELSLICLQKQGISNCSLFNGLTGLSIAIYLSSNHGKRYQNLLSKLDDFFIKEVTRSFLQMKSHYIKKEIYIPPYFYNLAQGISGIISYLLFRKDNPYLRKLAFELIDMLAQILSFNKQFDSHQVPGWYVSHDSLFFDEEKSQYPNGCFILNHSFGIAGCLAALSLAAADGFRMSGLYESIDLVSTWLKNKYQTLMDNECWETIIPLNINDLATPGIAQDSWANGWPALLRSLFLAGQTLNDSSLISFASNTYISLFNKTESNRLDPSFSFGKAGLLSTTYLMAKDMENYQLLKKSDSLENELKADYHPNLPFGFKVRHPNKNGNDQWTDDPGLLNGSIGIALSLMLVQQKLDPNLIRIFLI
jgi:hypothetical protein